MHTFGDVVMVNARVFKKNLRKIGMVEHNKDILWGLKGRKFVVVATSEYYGYYVVDMLGNKRHLPHTLLKRIRKANPAHVAKIRKSLEA
ncbi:MAG: hypothetical protein ACRCTP_04775 [Aeromonas popoffii]|uniref:hypothetical protein n=1 Tax=Aeromonas popoffii TaxID=70856 RepID=UPI003F3E4142